MNDIYDTVIIGSGPAGLTAAIYSIRAALKTVVIGGNQPGGQLTITTLVENYPGFPTGVGGVKLMMDTQQQVKNLGGEIQNDVVLKITNNQKPTSNFQIELASGKILKTRAVIVATGSQAKWLNLAREKELVGKGVSGCATCDGMFFKDRVVAVVGGGNVACQDAVFLAKFATKVYVIHRRDQLRAIAAEQQKVMKNPKIEVLWNTEIVEIVGKSNVEGLKVKNNRTGEEKTLAVEGLFEAIGHTPATEFLKGVAEMEDEGYVVIGKNEEYPTMTSVAGIFAAGDCTDIRYRQAIVAAGKGAMAALDAEKWLGNRERTG